MGMTFEEHVRETGGGRQQAVVFQKHVLPTTGNPALALPSWATIAHVVDDIVGPDARSWWNDTTPLLADYEVEVGMVLLDDWHLAESQCPPVGLVLVNDVTVRAVQMLGSGLPDPLPYWSAAKSFPGFLPVSSCMWCPHSGTLSAWPDLELVTTVNGERRQKQYLAGLKYAPADLIRLAASRAPGGVLRRHDLILCGTPSGVAFRVSPWLRHWMEKLPARWWMPLAWRMQAGSGRYLKPGDHVHMSAQWLGELTQTVEAL